MAAPVFDDETINTLQQLDAIDESNGNSDDHEPSEHKKHKGGFWKALLWILVILVLLVACAFVIDHYLFNGKGRDWAMQYVNIPSLKNNDNEQVQFLPEVSGDYDKDAARDNITAYTFSNDGLAFSDDEIQRQGNAIADELTPYINKYLKSVKQSKYEQSVVDAVRSFAYEELKSQLSDNRFHAESLLNYKDYVRESILPELKNHFMHKKTHAVMTEIMDYNTLDNLLRQVMPAEEVIPEPVPEPAKKANAGTKKADKPAATVSHITTASKQGFDLIAGFSVNKSSADRLCSQLKRKGCDAYIINRNGLYYVSMGSAASRTEIDAKYDHVKEWYKGDVTIKKW